MGTASERPRASAALVYRGRLWLALLLWLFALASIALAAATFLLGWPAVLLMGVPALGAAYTCLTFGLGEAIARVVLHENGFSLRLPRYRGYFPFPPVQRLEGTWSEVTALRRRRVNARALGVHVDYIAHRIETRQGSIVLIAPLPSDFMRNTRGTGLNLPAQAIAAEFARRTGLASQDEGEIWGGGLGRNLLRGGPRLWLR